MIEITTSACVGGIVTDIFSDGDCGFGRQDLIGRDKAIREAVQFHHNTQIDWQIVTMEDIRAKLADRLSAKGLENNETELFIKDVIRIVTSSPGFDIDAIKGQLNLLGWHDDYTDYGTIQLIQACYQDG